MDCAARDFIMPQHVGGSGRTVFKDPKEYMRAMSMRMILAEPKPSQNTISRFCRSHDFSENDIRNLSATGKINPKVGNKLDAILFPGLENFAVFGTFSNGAMPNLNECLNTIYSYLYTHLGETYSIPIMIREIGDVVQHLSKPLKQPLFDAQDLTTKDSERAKFLRQAMGVVLCGHHKAILKAHTASQQAAAQNGADDALPAPADESSPALSHPAADTAPVNTAPAMDTSAEAPEYSPSQPADHPAPLDTPAVPAQVSPSIGRSPTNRITDGTANVFAFGGNGRQRVTGLIEQMNCEGAEHVALNLLQKRLAEIRRLHNIKDLPASAFTLQFAVPKAPSFLHIKKIEEGRLPQLTQKDAEILDAFFTKAFYQHSKDTYRAAESNHPSVSDIMLAYRIAASHQHDHVASGGEKAVAQR